MLEPEKYLTYDQISLVPRFSIVNSRQNTDCSTIFLGRKFKIPCVPSPMKAVIDEDIARYLYLNSYFYIMHRFDIDILKFTEKLNEESWSLISISIGIKDIDYETLTKINKRKLRVDIFNIDVAYAYSKKCRKMVSFIKTMFPKAKIIVGNIASLEGYVELSNWGVDAVRLPVANGSVCTTKLQTGFYVPPASLIYKCANSNYYWRGNKSIEIKNRAKIIADGGLKCVGDIVKALALGADMVMSGKLFAACSNSPAVEKNNKKEYYGSASYKSKYKKEFIEGKTENIDKDFTYQEKLQEIEEGIRSAISYAGGEDVNSLREVEIIEI